MRNATLALIAEIMSRTNDSIGQTNAKIDQLRSEIVMSNRELAKEIRDQNALMLTGLRSELVTRLNSLPAELAKDDEAYKLLKQRLLSDFEVIFARREAK